MPFALNSITHTATKPSFILIDGYRLVFPSKFLSGLLLCIDKISGMTFLCSTFNIMTPVREKYIVYGVNIYDRS